MNNTQLTKVFLKKFHNIDTNNGLLWRIPDITDNIRDFNKYVIEGIREKGLDYEIHFDESCVRWSSIINKLIFVEEPLHGTNVTRALIVAAIKLEEGIHYE